MITKNVRIFKWKQGDGNNLHIVLQDKVDMLPVFLPVTIHLPTG